VGGERPDLPTLLITILVTLPILLGGLVFFRRMESAFADVI
jgi:ABC-type polysaccharide/polyol phosphate export permease